MDCNSKLYLLNEMKPKDVFMCKTLLGDSAGDVLNRFIMADGKIPRTSKISIDNVIRPAFDDMLDQLFDAIKAKRRSARCRSNEKMNSRSNSKRYRGINKKKIWRCSWRLSRKTVKASSLNLARLGSPLYSRAPL